MNKIDIFFKKLYRRKTHLNYLRSNIHILKYEILNDALDCKINKNKINLFFKYNKRLKLITFLR
jgi:hypothetical protein